jgi:hypothetical protein
MRRTLTNEKDAFTNEEDAFTNEEYAFTNAGRTPPQRWMDGWGWGGREPTVVGDGEAKKQIDTSTRVSVIHPPPRTLRPPQRAKHNWATRPSPTQPNNLTTGQRLVK